MKSDWPVNPPRPSDVNHPKGVKMMKNEIKWKNLHPQPLLWRLAKGSAGEKPWGWGEEPLPGGSESRTREEIPLLASPGFLWKWSLGLPVGRKGRGPTGRDRGDSCRWESWQESQQGLVLAEKTKAECRLTGVGPVDNISHKGGNALLGQEGKGLFLSLGSTSGPKAPSYEGLYKNPPWVKTVKELRSTEWQLQNSHRL